MLRRPMSFVTVVVVALGLFLSTGVPALAAPSAEPAATDRYLITFTSTKAASSARTGVTSGTSAPAAIPVVVARLTEAERSAMASKPGVLAIEKDRRITADLTTQTDPPSWGLDRLDQLSTALNRRLTTNADGTGVRVYIFDSGLDFTNSEFKATNLAGAAFSSGVFTSAKDCHGHGTHVTGTILGRTFGVAKNASYYPVRVLDCKNSAWTSDIIEAMDWVASEHPKGTPAVANLSLGGGYSAAQNAAVNTLVSKGITTVVAAGNDAEDACWVSPASAPAAITVGASTADDTRAGFSNYGKCLDILAPGEGITSAAIGGGSRTWDGTSMAAPHVTGIAALILQKHPRWTPAQVTARIKQLAHGGRLTGSLKGSPNLLASLAPSLTGLAGVGSGTTVTVAGQGLVGVTGVTFDGKLGSGIVGTSPYRLTVKAPAGTPSNAQVQVITELSVSSALRPDDLTKPTITSLSRTKGITSGGTSVVVTGLNFSGVTSARFGSRKAKLTRLSATQVTLVAPKSAEGFTQVRLVNAAGESAKSGASVFQFGARPSVSKVTPSKGKRNTKVTLKGKNFSSLVEVKFGSKAATVLSKSSKKIVVRAPKNSKGSKKITVITGFGNSTSSKKARFRYR